MQCYFPLNRVPDFVSGEENRAGLRCKYVRTRMLNNTREPSCNPGAIAPYMSTGKLLLASYDMHLVYMNRISYGIVVQDQEVP